LNFVVLGGRNRVNSLGKPEWTQFDLAMALNVDVSAGSVTSLLEYKSPPEVTAPQGNRAVLFKAGSLVAGHLYLCTQTEIMVYSYPEMKRVRYLSLPCFNDLHHVHPRENGNLVVVSTGLDMVFEIDAQDGIVNEWSTLDGSGWEKYDRKEDYRKWATTKPHLSHPNYAFEIGDRLWVTRFEQRDALCLDTPGLKMDIGIQKPHDGAIHDGRVYFTTVDGHIVIVDASTHKCINVVDLNKIENVNYSLGWCRGIHVVDKDKVIVGYSRIRPTKIQQNIRWVRHKLTGAKTSGLRPSRIVQYDLRQGRLDWEFSLEQYGMNALFSIHLA
jgi:hypothetical protein